MQSEYGSVYADLYRRHWWWRARESILLRAIARLDLPAPDRASILDVGCGDGLFFPALRRFGSVRGIEVDHSLLRPDNPDRPLIDTEPLGSPLYNGRCYDLITALDVIEHIEDDHAAVRDMVGMLNPGGHLLVTVPAFMCLWDHHDEINHHFRRYTRSGLRALAVPGTRVLELRYLFHAIFIPKAAVRALNRGRPGRKLDQFALPPRAVNRAMAAWCDTEERVLRRFGVPLGTSVLMVLRRV